MIDNFSRADSSQINVDPLETLIVKMFGSLAFTCVLSGGLTCALNLRDKTVVHILGIDISTTSVGIAFAAIGVFTAFFAAKSVLNSRRQMEVLRVDQLPKFNHHRSAPRGVAPSKAKRSVNVARDSFDRRRFLPNVVKSAATGN